MTQEALKLALEALKSQIVWFSRDTMIGKSMRQKTEKAITALEEALAEHAMRETQRLGQEIEQEPVAWMNKHGACISAVFKKVQETAGEYTTPLYTTSPERTWVGLTTVDRKEIERQSVYVEGAIRMTEAKLKEKNT